MSQNDKIKELKKYVNLGLVNGLTHTIHDGRRDNIEWVRKRLMLWESFGRCVCSLVEGNDHSYDEKELKRVAEEGYE